MRLMIALLGALVAADRVRAECGFEIYVSSDFGHEVLRYDAATGQLLDVLVPISSNGPLSEPHAIIARDTDVIVASFATDQVLRYDRAGGEYLGQFIGPASGVDAPVYLAYGPDGNLYISSQASDEILRFTPDGVLLGVFVAAGSGGLDGPSGFAFGPDGRLYVAGRYSANVLAYDGTTGAFDEVVLDSGDGLTSGDTFGLTFGGNGDLYVASNGQVFRYNVGGDTIVAAIPAGLAIGLETGPDGDVWVATGNNLRRIDADDSSLSSPFLTGGSINLLNFFHFAPVLPVAAGDGDCDGDADVADHALLVECLTGPGGSGPQWPAFCPAAFDSDADADVDLRDFAAFARLLIP